MPNQLVNDAEGLPFEPGQDYSEGFRRLAADWAEKRTTAHRFAALEAIT